MQELRAENERIAADGLRDPDRAESQLVELRGDLGDLRGGRGVEECPYADAADLHGTAS